VAPLALSSAGLRRRAPSEWSAALPVPVTEMDGPPRVRAARCPEPEDPLACPPLLAGSRSHTAFGLEKLRKVLGQSRACGGGWKEVPDSFLPLREDVPLKPQGRAFPLTQQIHPSKARQR
jgi:hypothetical protein